MSMQLDPLDALPYIRAHNLNDRGNEDIRTLRERILVVTSLRTATIDNGQQFRLTLHAPTEDSSLRR